MRRAIAWRVADKEDAAIAEIGGADVVAIQRLLGNLGDDCDLALGESADFVELEPGFKLLLLLGRRADDPAETGAVAIPGNGRIADGNRVRPLLADVAIARLGGQVAQAAIRTADVQVATAIRQVNAAAMVAEYRSDRGEIVVDRELGDDEDWIRQGLGGCSSTDRRPTKQDETSPHVIHCNLPTPKVAILLHPCSRPALQACRPSMVKKKKGIRNLVWVSGFMAVVALISKDGF